jgi:acetolactate synthase-1/3 small subunit
MEFVMEKKIFGLLVQNEPGVLAHIAGMFSARSFNIDSLVVGRTEDEAFSRMIIVTSGDEATLEQIRKQLGKIVTVVKVQDLSHHDTVERDLLLIRVNCPPEKRGELRQIAEVFRGSIVDIGPKSVILQLTGPEAKIEAFVDLCRPYGIVELSRTGVIAIARSNSRGKDLRAPVSVGKSRPRSVHSTSQEPEVALPPS